MIEQITAVIPHHGREELTAKVVEYNSRSMAVIPVGDNEIANKPLGEKFNYGFLHLYEEDIQGAMIVGSDDLIHPHYVSWLKDHRPLYTELGSCAFYNTVTSEMMVAEGMSLGPGKFFSVEYLKRCEFKPYRDEQCINMDQGPTRFLFPGERKCLEPPHFPVWCIDIKGPGSMWGWDWVESLPRTRTVDPDMIFAAFGEKEKDWRNLL